MLIELSVRDLGVIEELHLTLGAGLTAFTGETGAGKTLIVEAIGLLTGGRAETIRVRQGAAEAVVEGRFDFDGTEVILRRVIPADGRSRAYVNGEMATVATLSGWGVRLVDLHGQHGQQALIGTAAQRRELDEFAGIELGDLIDVRGQISATVAQLDELGGDAATRSREIDILQFQLDELDEAALEDANEDQRLEVEQDRLSDVADHRANAELAVAAVFDDGGVIDALGRATGALEGRSPFKTQLERLHAATEEIADAGRELRDLREQIVDDPIRLDVLRERRQLLRNLSRKYGDGTLQGVLDARHGIAARLDLLTHHSERAGLLAEQLETLRADEAVEAARVGAERRASAPRFAAQVQHELRRLAMPRAELTVTVSDGSGDEVQYDLAANPGSKPLPLSKVASGGELARTMLALRLVARSVSPTIVFDEVDAGVGGAAATAVGAALARVGQRRQVLVVTHLAQVAAAATSHVGVSKKQGPESTTTTIEVLKDEARVVELSRMLSGQPSSEAAHAHARQLLETGSQGETGG